MNQSSFHGASLWLKGGALIAMAVMLAACGESTSPIANTVTSNNNNVSGVWTYSATNVSGSGVTCNLSGLSMSLTQSGSSFMGSTSSGTSSCTFADGSSSEALDGVRITNGTISGNAVQFDIGSTAIHDVGTLSGNSMSGTVSIQVGMGGSTVVLTGPFSATRQ